MTKKHMTINTYINIFRKISLKWRQNSKIEDGNQLPNFVEKLYSKFQVEIFKNVWCDCNWIEVAN